MTAWPLSELDKYAGNPVHVLPAHDAATEVCTDACFLSVVRVEGLIGEPLDGHRYYAWIWSHGPNNPTEHNGGRMRLITAPRLEGPWTDRGHVMANGTAPDGWHKTSITGGDVVWSPRHRRFFSVPHAARCMHRETDRCEQGCVDPHDPSYVASAEDGRWRIDSFLLESFDGVTWTLSDVTQPVLLSGPADLDNHETGYGRLIRDPSTADERWLWLYRAQRVFYHYTLAVAEADDIYGPWRKVAGPVFEPTGGVLFGIGGLRHVDGRFHLLWADVGGDTYLARSPDLITWEEHPSAKPVFSVGAGAHEAYGTHGSFVTDDGGNLCYLYFSYNAENLAEIHAGQEPGSVSVNLAVVRAGEHPVVR